MKYEVIIVGGGPAGLSAALILGRCRRRVLVCDDGHPRNAPAEAIHGFLTRDGIPPDEFLSIARDELSLYGVEVDQHEVLDARPADDGFAIMLHDGQVHLARKLLLCTGVRDVLPHIPGFEQFYGHSIHHCPYCDGWEHRDKAIAAYGPDAKGAGLALSLRNWSEHVTVCTDGYTLKREDEAKLARCGIAVRHEHVARLEGEGSQLHRILFDAGPPVDCSALFFNTGAVQRSPLPARLGCPYDEEGHVQTSSRQRTPLRGLFLAGDADGDVQFVIVAAAEGATAAVAINKELQEEDRGEVRRRPFAPK